MKKKPETPPPENSLDKLAELTRRVLAVPKEAVHRQSENKGRKWPKASKREREIRGG